MPSWYGGFDDRLKVRFERPDGTLLLQTNVREGQSINLAPLDHVMGLFIAYVYSQGELIEALIIDDQRVVENLRW
jgi:hypothetical protein